MFGGFQVFLAIPCTIFSSNDSIVLNNAAVYMTSNVVMTHSPCTIQSSFVWPPDDVLYISKYETVKN